jgi:hypothetical protein
MDTVDHSTWRKASYSSNNGGACVETANAVSGVAVRDTTDRDGTTLVIPATAWSTFVASLGPVALSRGPPRTLHP